MILDPKLSLESNMSITTLSKPTVGNCTVKPTSGIAGITLFSITCVNFGNEDSSENNFEYYQKNKNDDSTVGKKFKFTHFIRKRRNSFHEVTLWFKEFDVFQTSSQKRVSRNTLISTSSKSFLEKTECSYGDLNELEERVLLGLCSRVLMLYL